jgi:hypothetical protein
MDPAQTNFTSEQDFVNKMLIVYAQNNEAFMAVAREFSQRESRIKALKRKPLTKL